MDRISKIGIGVSIGLLIALFAYNSQQAKKNQKSSPVPSPTSLPVKEAVMEKKTEEKAAVIESRSTPSADSDASPAVATELIPDLSFPEGMSPLRVETPIMAVDLHPFGGVISSVVLKENEKNGIRRLKDETSGDVVLFAGPDPVRSAGALSSPEIPLEKMTVKQDGRSAVFSLVRPDGVNIVKTYTINDHNYIIELEVTITNGSSTALIFRDDKTLRMVCGSLSPIEKKDDILGVDICTDLGAMIRKNVTVENTPEKVAWMGLKTKYFAAIMKSDLPASAYEITGKMKGGSSASTRAVLGCAGGPAPTQYEYLTGIVGLRGEIKPGESATYKFTYYLGPADYSLLKSSGPGFEKILNLGTFGFISIGIIWLLDVVYGVIGSYGWSIIIMTMIAKLILWPATHKSYKSMREMSKMQPLLAPLKEKYKNDPKKLQMETMKLYKEHGVSMWGGCLPMLLQMPILFALFNTLRNTIMLRKAPFWIIPGKWILDLSAPDALITLDQPFRLLILNIQQINLLPIIMGGSFYLQQKMTPQMSSGNPQSDQQQKMMAVMMPVMFLFIFYTMPAGMNLYFFVSTITSVLGQKFAARISKK